MSQAAVASPTSFLDRHHFLLRRLHSLSGIMPVGVFLMFHLFTNMQMAFGTFQHEVEFIHSLPALLFLEIFGLWLPIGFHAGLGFVYTFTGRVNVRNYKYLDNWRYTAQRVTGIIALIFIFVHIATLRWRWPLLGEDTPFFVLGWQVEGSEGLVPLATATTAMAIQSSILVAALYFIGVFSTVYHFANGLWTAAITWGLTLTKRAQQRWGLVCVAVFMGLAGFSTLALYTGMTYKPSDVEKASYKLTLEVYKSKGELPHKGGPVTPHDEKPVAGAPSAH